MATKNSEKKSKKINVNNFVNNPEDEANESWFDNGLHRFIIVFSVMWFGIVAVYLVKFFGLDNLFAMTPSEFSGFMTSITLPLAIVWVIMAYIDRGNNFRKETRMLRDSLNQVIFPDTNGSEATKMIAEAIKAQVAELKDVTRDVCAQSDVIKRDLTERINDMRELTEALDKYSSQSMVMLNEEVQKLIDNFVLVANKAASSSSDFRVNTMQIREDSEQMVNLMTPMVNQMVTAAERVKEVVELNNENIAKAQEQLNQYSESSQISIGRIIESWAERGENLEKTFLRTSENCEDLFRRLDSGISHIENSISEQKRVVETQSALIDKNSTYLDNKLGEYGKLISLEVESMIGRSNTLERNIQTQMKTIRETAAQVSEAFAHLGEDISSKRKLLETESIQVVNDINNTVSRLGEEMKMLQSFYANTQDKNSELSRVFGTVTQNLKEIENGLNKNVNNFSETANDIYSKFNDVNQQVGKNIEKLLDSSKNISEQSKNNATMLLVQDEYINKALTSLKNMSAKIHTLNKDLSNTGVQVGDTLEAYEDKMNKFGELVNQHLSDLRDNYDKTEKHVDDFNRKFKAANVDVFMKNSADILTELEALSIDINAIFDKAGKDDSLWKKYYEGDHSAFVRYLSKNMTKKEVVAIKEDYENKADFRIIVDKYIDDFNQLVTAARENERSNTLLAMISGSDIGKVYYILAKALGKIK